MTINQKILITVLGLNIFLGYSKDSLALIPFGFIRKLSSVNCAIGTPSPGTICKGGTIFLGTLASGGATSSTGPDSYMTTPGGCGDIPAGSITGGSGYSAYSASDFTPTCSGTDKLNKYWNSGTSTWYDIPNLPSYSTTIGTGHGSSNTDANYGSTNTSILVSITAAASGGYHAAAWYCDKLSYGGYTDWYLPNRYELNLFWINASSIPGLDKAGSWYLSSTEYNNMYVWMQKYNDGAQNATLKNNNILLRCVRKIDPCEGAPTPGTLCNGGPIFLGTLSPGATSGSGTDRYMTTPGGCGDIPSGQIGGGTGTNAWPSSDFTPTCAGTDNLLKTWNNGISNTTDIPELISYTTQTGTGKGSINTDQNYGNVNTSVIAAITQVANGGYHAAARYCDKLNYGGYSDWYLPSRYELNLFWTNKANISGLDTTGTFYWSSTEWMNDASWNQRFSDGYQDYADKAGPNIKIRCIRRY